MTVGDIRAKTSGVQALASYSKSSRFAVSLGATYEDSDFRSSGETLFAASCPDVTTVVALLQARTPAHLGTLETTFALRARSPIEFTGLDSNFNFAVKESSWITRFDARIAKKIQIGALGGSLWIDGLRLLGSSVFWDETNAGSPSTAVEAHRQTLGGGTINDNINLASLETAGAGVRNDVDLYFLQKAEARYGNGDGMFSAVEQRAAFGAAVRAQALAGKPLSQSRRIQLGLQIDF